MAGKGRRRVPITRGNIFLIILVCLAIFLIVVLALAMNEPVRTMTNHGPGALSPVGQGADGWGTIWVNTTKTTGGWPLLHNDIYNTMGLELIANQRNHSCIHSPHSGAPYEGDWEFFFTVCSIASSRAENSNKSTNSIKSHTLKIISKQNNTGAVWADYWDFQSWPCKTVSPKYYFGANEYLNWTTLYPVVVNEIDNYTEFPLAPIEFAQLQGHGFGDSRSTGREMWGGNISKLVRAQYTQALLGNLSDCGYTYNWFYVIPPGKTAEFDIVTTTCWGLFETSEVSLHVKITAPPNPYGMPEAELKKNYIEDIPVIYKDGFVSHSYGVNAGNISIEVT